MAGMDGAGRRGTRWYTLGRRPTLGVPGEPWPRWASTAHPEALSSRQAAVTVRSAHPARAAMVARVIATWRPVPWSAWSAITAAIDSRVVAVIDTRSAAHSVARARDCAH
ncbi:hypothetical protein D2E82_23425 [Mycobacteroides abscessus]|nr:hypothetical protein D2E82_23425 [Mycobacteroides abscessus]